MKFIVLTTLIDDQILVNLSNVLFIETVKPEFKNYTVTKFTFVNGETLCVQEPIDHISQRHGL